MTNLVNCSALELAEMVRARQISAEEILDETLTRIVEVDGRPGALDTALAVDDEKKVHAFITHTEELARSQAQEVDAKIAKGEDAGLLAGVPFTVKIFSAYAALLPPPPRAFWQFHRPVYCYTSGTFDRLEG